MRSWLPVSTPGGILICSLRSIGTWPSPRQVLQGSATMRPVPRQRLQVRATLKKPCWKVTWPAPRQVGQVVGLRARGGAAARAGGAGLGPRDPELGLGAEGRLLEGELEVVAQVRSAARAAAPAAEGVAEAEEVAEDVAEVGEDRGVEAGRRPRR